MALILWSMCGVILGLAVYCVVLWTELQHERSRNFNARVFARLKEMDVPQTETRVILYDREEDGV